MHEQKDRGVNLTHEKRGLYFRSTDVIYSCCFFMFKFEILRLRYTYDCYEIYHPPLRLPMFYLLCLEVLNPYQEIQISESPIIQFFYQNKRKI